MVRSSLCFNTMPCRHMPLLVHDPAEQPLGSSRVGGFLFFATTASTETLSGTILGVTCVSSLSQRSHPKSFCVAKTTHYISSLHERSRNPQLSGPRSGPTVRSFDVRRRAPMYGRRNIFCIDSVSHTPCITVSMRGYKGAFDNL